MSIIHTGVVLEFTLADRLRKAREHAGLEQRELADRLGIHRQSVARYEKGDAEPRLPVLRTWAMETGVDLDWLEDGVVRPEGLEPPTFWSVADRCLICGGDHDTLACDVDVAFLAIACQVELDTETPFPSSLG